MRVALVCADLEENLGAGLLAALAERAGHEVAVVAFDVSEQAPGVARRLAASAPDVVGLSIQFQHEAF